MKTVVHFAWMFLIVGMGLLGGAGYLTAGQLEFIDGAQRAQGEVVEMVRRGGSKYAPRVRFAGADGSERFFTSSTSSNPPSFSVGEQVVVLYNRDGPANAVIDSFGELWGVIFILGVLGTVFFLIGAGIFVSRFLAAREDEDLAATGRRIMATYQGVELNTTITVNGRSPYRVVAQWLDPATNKVRLFRSHNLWFDPTQFMDRKELTVLIDPRRPKRYHVDLSFLPELAE